MNITQQIQQLADALYQAEETKQAIEPIAAQLQALAGNQDPLELAYKVQQINHQRRLQTGARIVGKKIGLTSRAVQEQIGVNQPDYGSIYAHSAYGPNQILDSSQWIQPKAEAEVAFVLAKDLNHEQHTLADIISATAYVLPAFEIVDSRIKDWQIALLDTVADNASYAAFVLGAQPIPLSQINLSDCRMSIVSGEQTLSNGLGSNCLGNPLNAAAWLANRMVAMSTPLQAGDILLSGALGPMVTMKAGQTLTAHIEGLGSLSMTLE